MMSHFLDNEKKFMKNRIRLKILFKINILKLFKEKRN